MTDLPPSDPSASRLARRRGVVASFALALLTTGCSTLFGPLPTQVARPLALRSQIRSSDGTVLATLFEENRVSVSSGDIPKVVKDAVVAVEDARFWDHSGVDAKAIARAALANLAKGETVQGGSTITQQLAKLMYFPTEERTFKIKLAEARAALRLERDHAKEEILTMYLNRAYFGAGAYGIAAAAETYFRTKPAALTLPQAALLAGIIRSPESLNPFDEPEPSAVRRSYVLRRMREEHMITSADEQAAAATPLGVAPRRPPFGNARYPYFVEFVKQQLLADPAFGATETERAERLFRGGLQITTTLDRRLQDAAERAVAEVLNRPGDPDAALVAIDPKTGAVRAMVGGRDFGREQFNLAYQGRRQAGSAFKPFVLAAALEQGIRPEARYGSSPTTLRYGPGNALSWTVNNYDGRGRGIISLREGMINSVNGVYARLVLDVGPSSVVDVAHRLGITSELDALPSIALGGLRVGVSPFEMASAYSTFANLGVHMPGHGIARAVDDEGETVFEESQIRGVPAIDPGIAYTMNDVLQDVVRFGTGRRADIDRPLAGKTGTTQEYHDAWFVGYTPDLVTAIWVGYRKAQISMRNVRGVTVVGGTFPSQIFRAFMGPALADVPPNEFGIPTGSFVSVVLGFSRDCVARLGQPGVEVEMPLSLVPVRDCPVYRPSPKPTSVASPAPTAGPTSEPTTDPGPEPVATPT